MLKSLMFKRGKRFIKQILGRDLWTSPQVKRPKEYIGTEYAGYCICPCSIGPQSIVYSAGVGKDIEFDRMMIEKFGVDIFAFDPTPKSVNWVKSQRLPEKFRFYSYGLAHFDGKAVFNPPENPEHVSYSMTDSVPSNKLSVNCKVYRLTTIMKMLGHHKIDILKMDIEGAEYAVLTDIINSGICVGQIAVEFHQRKSTGGIANTRKTIQKLNSAGYRIFHISPSGDEYSFIHTQWLSRCQIPC